jgi:hypothetical protein
MVRLLGEEMVCLCMLRRKEEEQLDERQLYVEGRERKKEPMVFWAKRWSALEGEPAGRVAIVVR